VLKLGDEHQPARGGEAEKVAFWGKNSFWLGIGILFFF